MTTMTLDQQDDQLIVNFLNAERQFLLGNHSVLSQENLGDGFRSTINMMHGKMESDVAAMRAANAEKTARAMRASKLFYSATGIVYLAAFGALVAAIAVGTIAAIKQSDSAEKNKAEVLKTIREKLKSASKPGLKVDVVDGSDTRLGKLTINGRPASQIKDELEAMAKSDKAMTPEEYDRCLKVIRNGSEKFLKEMDDLHRIAEQYRTDASSAYTDQLVFGLVFAPISLAAWCGYRIYQWLIRKFS